MGMHTYETPPWTTRPTPEEERQREIAEDEARERKRDGERDDGKEAD